MHIDLSAMTPATRAVLDAVHYLGQGNVHELADQSGKARSTTDKAIKALADAGLIVPVDTDAEAAEGVPTRWTMAEGVTESITADGTDPDMDQENGLGDAGTAADTESDSDPDLGDNTVTGDDWADESPQPGAEPDGGDATGLGDSASNDGEDENSESTDSQNPDGEDSDEDVTEPDGEDDDQDSDDGEDQNSGRQNRGTITIVQPSRPGDRKIMTIKMVLTEHGDDGATLDEIVAESGIGHPTSSRLLTAMEQADAARRLPGTPSRWVAGPTKASDVDPNPEPPRCPLCYQVIKGVAESPEAVAQIQPLIRPDGTIHVTAEDGTPHVVKLPKRLPPRTTSTTTAGAVRRTDLTVNGDGSQPFGKGELETLTLAVLSAMPDREMTPQEIATEISGQLGGRNVSSGAVRNNCTKAAAAGRIEMVKDSPLTFVYPAPAGDDKAAEAEPADTQADADTTGQGGGTAESDTTADMGEISNDPAEGVSGGEQS